MLAVTAVQQITMDSISGFTGEKPESKVWEYNNTWWSVWSHSNGTYVHRLDGAAWTPVLKLTSTTSMRADVKPVGNVAHILLHKNSSVQLASVEYVSGSSPTYKPWSWRPSLSSLTVGSDVEAATVDVDSTGRMWIAYENVRKIETRYANFPYSSWSSAIVLASNVNDDDISVVTALPDRSIGVFWSNQTTKRFGFRRHTDGASSSSWSGDEVPASQSALNVGLGMADDHLHVAVASDGTLYAAIKTGYDTSGYPQLGLLVRRPNGTWDNLRSIDTVGTRPIVQLNEAKSTLLYTYRVDASEPIVYRECSTTTLVCTSRKTLISDPNANDPSSSKQNFTDDLVIIASGLGKISGARVWLERSLTATFQDGVSGYTGTRDAMIKSASSTSNFGTTVTTISDGDPDIASLIQWNITSIPASSKVDSVSIVLNAIGKTPDTYEFYEVLRPWVESSVTWTKYSSSSNWQTAGAQGSGDRGTTVLGIATAPNPGLVTIDLKSAGVAVVQKWVNSSSTNMGLILQDYFSATNGIEFDSSEASVSSNRPKLMVTYTTSTASAKAEGESTTFTLDVGVDIGPGSSPIETPITLLASSATTTNYVRVRVRGTGSHIVVAPVVYPAAAILRIEEKTSVRIAPIRAANKIDRVMSDEKFLDSDELADLLASDV